MANKEVYSVHEAALTCIKVCTPSDKVQLTRHIAAQWELGKILPIQDGAARHIAVPGRPHKPRLVPPTEVSRRRMGTPEGHAALIHALVHIEFNAINLAWDAVYRFRGLPHQYYGDWIKVAQEESYHFSILVGYLKELGYAYGDFVAHDGLWDMAVRTEHDGLIRMALVPRILEARGLDVTPGMIERLIKHGYNQAADILKIIYQDEIGHVETGSRWFRYYCRQRAIDPVETFNRLVAEFAGEKVRPPINREARKMAGFTDAELSNIELLIEKS